MVSTDPIADMLTRIRNAIAVNRNVVELPYSKLKHTVADQLKAAHFVHDVTMIEGKPGSTLQITINRVGEPARINTLEKISKPGRRVYAAADEIPRVKYGRGIVIISTSKGVMSGEEAAKQRLGGELICRVF